MQGRRTFLIATVVALVAIAASAGIAALHLHADERRDRYEMLVELESSANRVDALESEANAERRVPLRGPGRARARCCATCAPSSTTSSAAAARARQRVLRLFDAYQPLIEEEFALMRARDFERAAAIDRQRRLRAASATACARAAERNHAARRAQRPDVLDRHDRRDGR